MPHKEVVYNSDDDQNDEDKNEDVDLMILDDIQQLRRILDGLIALSDNCEIFFNSQTAQIENGAID